MASSSSVSRNVAKFEEDFQQKLYSSLVGTNSKISPDDLAASLRWAVLNGRGDLIPKFIQMANGNKHVIFFIWGGEKKNFFEPFFFQKVLNSPDADGKAALIVAALSDHHDVMEQLLKGKANPDLRYPSTDETALMIVSGKGSTEGIRILLSHRASLSLKDCEGNTALMIASRNGHNRAVVSLCTGVIDLTNSKLKTALHLAAENGKEKCVMNLLDQGANPFLLDVEHKSALLLAVENNFVSTALQLIVGIQFVLAQESTSTVRPESSLHPFDVGDLSGSTPLIVAAREGFSQICDMLLSSGAASVNVQDADGLTPLAHAARHESPQLLMKLLAHDASVSIMDRKGLTPLHHAVIADRPACILELLRAKADSTRPDCDGVTPMV